MSPRVFAMAPSRSARCASRPSTRSRSWACSSAANGLAAPSSWNLRRSEARRPGDGGLGRRRHRRPLGSRGRDGRAERRALVLHRVDVARRVQRPQAHGAQAGELHERLLANRVQRETSLQLVDLRRPMSLLGPAQGVTGRRDAGLGGALPLATGEVRRTDRIERLAGSLFPRGGLRPGDVPNGPRGVQLGVPACELVRLRVQPVDPLLGDLGRGFGAGAASLGGTSLGVADRASRRERLPAPGELRGARLPGGERARHAVAELRPAGCRRRRPAGACRLQCGQARLQGSPLATRDVTRASPQAASRAACSAARPAWRSVSSALRRRPIACVLGVAARLGGRASVGGPALGAGPALVERGDLALDDGELGLRRLELGPKLQRRRPRCPA